MFGTKNKIKVLQYEMSQLDEKLSSHDSYNDNRYKEICSHLGRLNDGLKALAKHAGVKLEFDAIRVVPIKEEGKG